MKKVYVAGKLNDQAVNYIENTHKMMKAADTIRRMGFAAYVPGLDVMMGLAFGNYTYDMYFDNNIEFLKVCDYVYVCPGYETSKGTLREIELAKELEIPVIFELNTLSGIALLQRDKS